ncbi:hypothetical protein NKR23_g10457 [Pleurostoma richardsiae]|uniref:NB-ARC domain-containing protein n=1 Tax=Pleurostoma richardsiae TaxID=41990 RepID=A0AA38R565_9PEZI|nr:hypothetical protein NKR23_g10457 [Pleurostoma richardsiae]
MLFPANPDFVQKPEIMDWIQHRCARPADRDALVRLGGIGKSQLAIQYAHRVRERYPNTWVFWVHAGRALNRPTKTSPTNFDCLTEMTPRPLRNAGLPYNVSTYRPSDPRTSSRAASGSWIRRNLSPETTSTPHGCRCQSHPFPGKLKKIVTMPYTQYRTK